MFPTWARCPCSSAVRLAFSSSSVRRERACRRRAPRTGWCSFESVEAPWAMMTSESSIPPHTAGPPTRIRSFTSKKWINSELYNEIDGMPMPVPITEIWSPSVGAGEAEHPAYFVEALGFSRYVSAMKLGLQRVAGEQDRLGDRFALRVDVGASWSGALDSFVVSRGRPGQSPSRAVRSALIVASARPRRAAGPRYRHTAGPPRGSTSASVVPDGRTMTRSSASVRYSSPSVGGRSVLPSARSRTSTTGEPTMVSTIAARNRAIASVMRARSAPGKPQQRGGVQAVGRARSSSRSSIVRPSRARSSTR